MSNYKPRKGDRVRAIFEGDVLDAGFEFFNLDGWDLPIEHRALVSIEKVTPPLPVVVGSVILKHTHKDPLSFVLTRDGWMSPRTGRIVPDAVFEGEFEVIYDARSKR